MQRPNGNDSGAGADEVRSEQQRSIDRVREFWNEFEYDDVKATEHRVGTKEFFADLEGYRSARLDYLPRVVDFGGYNGKRVLEVGCRIGLDLARFARNGAQVTGIDLAGSCIYTARQYLALHDLEADLLVMNGEDLEFEDESFDLVYAFGVVQYTCNPTRMVGEIHRVLRGGGDAILMVYNRYSWLALLSALSGSNLAHEEAPAFQPYSIAQFRRLLGDFADVEIRAERFPLPTSLHKGLAARLYYGVFVGAFNLLPRTWVRSFGAHLIAKARR
jgi:2-polyprenyl-3-methyl-5-hydroxy-6-metoxy-1,4-benzoquinol methylase